MARSPGRKFVRVRGGFDFAQQVAKFLGQHFVVQFARQVAQHRGARPAALGRHEDVLIPVEHGNGGFQLRDVD